MGSTNLIYKFNGDPTQAMDDFVWRSPSFLLPSQKTPLCVRVMFDEGDLLDYYATVAAIQDIVSRNSQRVAEGFVEDGGGGAVGGGFGFGWFPIGGSALETVPDTPIYAGSLGLTLNVYGDDVLKHTAPLYKSGIYNISTGWRAREVYFELVGNVPVVRAIDIATSVKELKTEPGIYDKGKVS